MPMFCSSGNFQQSSPTTMYGVCSMQDYLSPKATPLSLLLNFVYVSAVLPPHFRHFRSTHCIMVPCTVHIFCFPQNNKLEASVQLFCQNMCRFLTTTLQEFQVAGAVLPEEQCTVLVLQSAFLSCFNDYAR
ncbi:hypothetical protein T4D_15394 [Trichinella pseudospiralis]|uniref:Uncharacterized protein n=1 Tax=Trichinella pseudospiralis TaxID=6337 RepID=A0A0V1F5C3_TRIPS|nr:hypothetical protein T4D_15394 [Trichinella pseudospiralis]